MVPEPPATLSTEMLLKENAQLRIRVACLEERCRELEVIRVTLKKTAVAGADETGMRAEGSLYRLHVMRDEQWTLYYLPEKRGLKAMDAMGILLTFAGVLVHDH